MILQALTRYYQRLIEQQGEGERRHRALRLQPGKGQLRDPPGAGRLGGGCA